MKLPHLDLNWRGLNHQANTKTTRPRRPPKQHFVHNFNVLASQLFSNASEITLDEVFSLFYYNIILLGKTTISMVIPLTVYSRFNLCLKSCKIWGNIILLESLQKIGLRNLQLCALKKIEVVQSLIQCATNLVNI